MQGQGLGQSVGLGTQSQGDRILLGLGAFMATATTMLTWGNRERGMGLGDAGSELSADVCSGYSVEKSMKRKQKKSRKGMSKKCSWLARVAV